MLDQLLGQVIAGKYRIESLIRLSGPGRLYRAHQIVIDRPATVLVLEPAFAGDGERVQRFEHFGRSVAKVVSDNVLKVTDLGSDGLGFHYVVFEPVEGRTLQETLADDGKLELLRAVTLIQDILSGVEAFHTKGAIHGKLSPASVLVVQSAHGEHAKLFDPSVDADDLHSLNRHYRAPEFDGEGLAADARADIYSAGVVMYELLAGETPFSNSAQDSGGEFAAPPPPISAFRHDVPAGLEQLILRMLATDPEMRPQSAAETASEISALFGSGNQGSRTGNNIWKTVAAAVAGMIILAAALIYATSSRMTDPATALQTDLEGLPVQPLNPATGSDEDKLAAMPPDTVLSNANSALIPGEMPGGDGYNPWASGAPPPGAPTVGPGGKVVAVPSDGSQFMPPDSGTILYTIDPNGRCLRLPTYEVMPCPPGAGRPPKPQPSPTQGTANTETKPVPDTLASPKPLPSSQKPSATPSLRPSPSASDQK